jgi:hypothetical protein
MPGFEGPKGRQNHNDRHIGEVGPAQLIEIRAAQIVTALRALELAAVV